MSEWKVKRFWKAATVSEAGGGYTVLLDGRQVKTPAKADLIVPSRALAEAIRAEWDAQEGEVRPQTMPVTRSANAALDKVTAQHTEVADMVAAYGDTDLLCYRAVGPDSLIARQAAAWDPLLDWADRELGARLIPVAGVMHSPQDARALRRLAERVHGMDAFTLTAFHDLVGLSGSLVLGFAALMDYGDAHDIWALSRVDETWQEEQWGVDEDARATAAVKEKEFVHAKRFHDLAKARP